MSIVLTAIVFILIFSVLVIIHELGHFWVAKRAGIKVEEFGFGLPPRIWGKKKGETMYSINAIPFGGFVRLYGEDSHDQKVAKSKRSYSGKSARTRIMVVAAGVFMNYILSLVLLTIGFIAGMQPLLVESDDFFAAVDQGVITLQEGMVIKKVEPNSSAARAGLLPEDVITGLNGEELPLVEDFNKIIKEKDDIELSLQVHRNGQTQNIALFSEDRENFGLEFYESLDLPRVVVNDVKDGSPAATAGLQRGDRIVTINGQNVYFSSQIQDILAKHKRLELQVLRNFTLQTLNFDLPQSNSLVITRIAKDSKAEQAGFLSGDIVISINGVNVSSFEELKNVTNKDPYTQRSYTFLRNGELKELQVVPDKDGSIGIFLSTIFSYENNFFSFYDANFPVSAIAIKNVQYPVWEAPGKAFEEAGKLASVTVGTVVSTIRSVFTQFSVPEGIAGPVGIARLTHTFVQEGFLPVLRLMALLSLSLAIMNILPFPALDGGRLFLILAEVIVGKKLSARFESLIHAVGFVILLALILLVTYNDIVNIFR